MDYKKVKKVAVWLALMCVFALPMAATFTTEAFAQGGYRRYDRRARDYQRDQWRRRQSYRPWARPGYQRYPYRYRPGYRPRVGYPGYRPRVGYPGYRPRYRRY